MSRIAFALIAFSLISAPAEAATLIHPSAVAKTTEHGVAVWRGKAPEKFAPPKMKPAAPCSKVSVAVRFAGYPARALRTHGFWSGEDYAAAYQATTQGFYADRMAAGL
jgi:hypothetical protein